MPFWTSHKKRQYSDMQRPSVLVRKLRNTCLLLSLFTDIHRAETPKEPLKGRSGQLSVFEEVSGTLGRNAGDRRHSAAPLSISPEGPEDIRSCRAGASRMLV